MSSGLRFSASFDPGYTTNLGYPDHSLGYTEAINVY